jgi:hypothetical protein
VTAARAGSTSWACELTAETAQAASGGGVVGAIEAGLRWMVWKGLITSWACGRKAETAQAAAGVGVVGVIEAGLRWMVTFPRRGKRWCGRD